MALPGNLQQHIQVGTENQAATSDSLFAAFTKVENNFNNVFAYSSPYTDIVGNTGINVVTAGNVLSITNTGVVNLIEGTGVSLSGSNGAVTISVSGDANGNLVAGVTKVGVLSNTLAVSNSPVISQGNISVDLPTIGTVIAGEYTAPTVTIDQYGRVTNIANTVSTGTVTSIALTAGDGLAITGSPVTTSGEIVVTNTGVLRLTAGTGIALTANTGNITITSTNDSAGTVKRVGLISSTLDVSASKITSIGDLSVELKDDISLSGNLVSNIVKTDHLQYANGVAWNFGESAYGNSNVELFITTYTGNIGANVITANKFSGNGAQLTNLTGANVAGNVAFANYAYNVDGANVTGQVAYANVANRVAGGNVTGTVSAATVASSANSVAGANVTGQVSYAAVANSVAAANITGTITLAATAATVTTAAQPNITSLGILANLRVSGSANLGSNSNIIITGGTSGQFLATNGAGNLSWTTGGNLYQTTLLGNSTNVAVSFTNSTDSTTGLTGAVKITGGLGVSKSIAIEQQLYVGNGAGLTSFNNPTIISKRLGSDFIQAGLINGSTTGSADWVAYGDSSDDTQGWADMGFAGSAFNDGNYSITKPNDGYLFVQGVTGSAGGNLVLATGAEGSNHDIVFATGGFGSSDETARINHESRTLEANLITLTGAPATASSTGIAGQIAYDSTHVYICIATDTWKRASLASW